MSKTGQALDELASSIITLIPTWLSMLKSTRFLTMLGSGVIMYLTATQGGLTETQTMMVDIATAVTGVSFMGFKTLRGQSPKADSVEERSPAGTQPNVSQPAGSQPSYPVIKGVDWDALMRDWESESAKQLVGAYAMTPAQGRWVAFRITGNRFETDITEDVSKFADMHEELADAMFAEANNGIAFDDMTFPQTIDGCVCAGWNTYLWKRASLKPAFEELEYAKRKVGEVWRVANSDKDWQKAFQNHRLMFLLDAFIEVLS
jgi:hypothetical protein